MKKVVAAHEIAGAFLNIRANGWEIVATAGCFDILHVGHTRFLREASRLGHVLAVCVNSDASIRRLKGPGRPIVQLADRLEMLSELAITNYLVSFDDDTPNRVLDLIQPKVYVKGGDYQHKDLPERATVEKRGGKVVILPYTPGHSTTALWAALGNVDGQGQAG